MSTTIDVRVPPPVTHAHDGGGGSGWAVLTRVGDLLEAHLLGGRLTEAGIESRTQADPSVPGAWLYGGSNQWAPVLVMVRRMQLVDARMVLAEIAWEGPSVEPEQVSPSPRASRPLIFWVVAVGLAMFFTAVGLVEMHRQLTSCEGVRCGTGPGSP